MSIIPPPPPAHAPGLRAWFIDERRVGSPWQQALVGFVGISLAITLIVGQVSLAMARGIQNNVHANIRNLQEGNATTREIIEKAEPSKTMEAVVADQTKILDGMYSNMTVLTKDMKAMDAQSKQLVTTVRGMRDTSRNLSRGVQGMNRDTLKIVDAVESLPPTVDRLDVKLVRIAGDAGAINGEMQAIGGKLNTYGLPQARKTKR